MDDKQLTEPDYRAMLTGDLLGFLGVDAKKWARAFMVITKDKVLNEDEMICWFANAIEAGKAYKG